MELVPTSVEAPAEPVLSFVALVPSFLLGYKPGPRALSSLASSGSFLCIFASSAVVGMYSY